ncbi:hypothetical protein FSP39_014021 [Pinctada imbricata]|uniref:5'-nucleotidase n=1 Tax=Pinctada imbricata TaxID=66713 RepID=A0AA88Y980_PINIB|nr:hypothetical protein FSP39_014021 [Pinctada imbricata]
MYTLTEDVRFFVIFLFYFLVSILPSGHGFNLTILHTNDVHARYNETNKYSGQCSSQNCYGGAARQKTIIKQLRQRYPDSLLLDAGDQFQGTLWFSHYGGQISSVFMNDLNYDAMALGNHEFDRGIDGLLQFLRNASFTILSCNIDTSKESSIQPYIAKHYIASVGSERIGVIGYTTKETPIISNPGSLIFHDEVESVRREVQALTNSGVNKIIAVGHAGFSVDKRIASEVEGVDVVVGGHTNTFLYTGNAPSNEDPQGDYPHMVTQSNGDKVLVVQDYAYSKYMGLLHVEFDDNGKVVSYGGNPILLDSSIAKDNDTQGLVDEYGNDILTTLSNVIGRALVHLEGDRQVCRQRECNLGNVIADGMVSQNLRAADSVNFTNVFVSLVNSGAIRASIPKGTITVGQVIEVQPFRNTVEIIKLQGIYLRQALEYSVAGLNPTDPNGKFLQYSGIRVKYDLSKGDGKRVVEAKILCHDCNVPEFQDLDDSKMYPIILSNFILGGGDGYSMIRDHAVQETIMGTLDSDIFEEYIKNFNPTYQGLEGRIEFVTSNPCLTGGSSNLASHIFTLIISTLFTVVVLSS